MYTPFSRETPKIILKLCFTQTLAHLGSIIRLKRKNGWNSRKSNAWTVTTLKGQAQNGCLLAFSMLTWRLVLTGSRCWEQAPYQTGFGILPTVDRWWRWIPSMTTSASGAALLFTKVPAKNQSTAAAKKRARSFLKLSALPANLPKTSLDELENVEKHLNREKQFSDWLGIRVFFPERLEDGEVVWHLTHATPVKLTNIMTIYVYDEHAFLIKTIEKLAKTYECKHCHSRFTRIDSLKRHSISCSRGETLVDCRAKRVEAPETNFERAFFPKHTASKESLRWLDQEAKRRKIHIHHAECGHGGERLVEHALVDGYNHETRTVFQYHGCHWHGCRKCYPNDRNKIIDHNQQTRQ